MFTFNNETIFTGYIKQLLSDFNLPKYRVYTQADAKYHEEAVKHNAEHPDDLWPEESINIIESKNSSASGESYTRYINYIKENSIKRYIKENNTLVWKTTKWHYHYNKKELNETKNLVVKSNIYDSYTHEYLGDYLRFQRDYNNLDLMSMYNCFSNVICHNLFINHNEENKINFTFDSDNKNYKIYIVPVKLFKKYTIAIDSAEPIEMCCSFYSKYYQKELDYDYKQTNATLIPNFEETTYIKYNSMTYSNPVVYDKLWVSMDKKNGALVEKFTNDDERTIIVQKENDLKLFIKVPLNNNSSITILEGDYTNYGSKVLEVIGANARITENKSITNFSSDYEYIRNPVENSEEEFIVNSYFDDKYVPTTSNQPLKPICSLQLLAGNTGISHPFADRLLEYLLENVITHLDETTDNIKRVQEVIGEFKNSNLPESHKKSITLDGIWDDSFKHYLYQSITNNNSIQPNDKQDLLGYVDKTAEKNYSAGDITISNVDIYPNIYKSNKK